jgi:hypothetical protein
MNVSYLYAFAYFATKEQKITGECGKGWANSRNKMVFNFAVRFPVLYYSTLKEDDFPRVCETA